MEKVKKIQDMKMFLMKSRENFKHAWNKMTRSEIRRSVYDEKKKLISTQRWDVTRSDGRRKEVSVHE